MYVSSFAAEMRREIDAIKADGLYKTERVITTPQDRSVSTVGPDRQSSALNFCANNYLGLANHPDIRAAAHAALDSHGLGMASVRFICGTSDLHIALEKTVSQFLEVDDTILYNSCFDANTGFFETLLGSEDAVISDQLNHASIIDGIRLSKAQRHRYPSGDMDALESCLKAADDCRRKVIATDGVFSMDGEIAKLADICDLAEKYGALVFVDDSHGLGVIGATGRGSAEHQGVLGRVDIFAGTFGKALGGGCGGFIAGRHEVVSLLRQRSRPYLFSNAMPPPIVASTLKAFELLVSEDWRLRHLKEVTARFRTEMTAHGFSLGGNEHPISRSCSEMQGWPRKCRQRFLRRVYMPSASGIRSCRRAWLESAYSCLPRTPWRTWIGRSTSLRRLDAVLVP